MPPLCRCVVSYFIFISFVAAFLTFFLFLITFVGWYSCFNILSIFFSDPDDDILGVEALAKIYNVKTLIPALVLLFLLKCDRYL